MDIQAALIQRQQQLEEAEAMANRLRGEIHTLRAALSILQGDSAAVATAGPSVVETSDIGGAEEEQAVPGRILIQEIRNALGRLKSPVSTKAVRDWLQALDPEWFKTLHYSSVSGTMRRMAETGEVVIVAKGGPGKEASYRLPTPEEVEHRSDGGADEQLTIEGEREQVESAH